MPPHVSCQSPLCINTRVPPFQALSNIRYPELSVKISSLAVWMDLVRAGDARGVIACPHDGGVLA